MVRMVLSSTPTGSLHSRQNAGVMTYALQGLAPLRARIAAWMPQWENSAKEVIIWSEGKKHHAIRQPSEASSQKAIPSPTLPKKRCPYKYPTSARGPDLLTPHGTGAARGNGST